MLVHVATSEAAIPKGAIVNEYEVMRQTFDRTKKQLLGEIDGRLYPTYGQFTHIDKLLDDFRAKVEALEFIGFPLRKDEPE